MHRELLKQRLLIAVEKVVAPVDQCLQRDTGRVGGRVSCRSVVRCSRRDAISASASTFTRAAASSSASGRPSDPSGDLGRKGDSIGIGIKARSRGPRPLDEELHRCGPEGRDRQPHLAGYVK